MASSGHPNYPYKSSVREPPTYGRELLSPAPSKAQVVLKNTAVTNVKTSQSRPIDHQYISGPGAIVQSDADTLQLRSVGKRIKKFKLSMINVLDDGKRIFICAGTGTGKSTLIHHLLRYLKDFIHQWCIVNPNEDNNDQYSKSVHPLLIHTEPSIDLIKRIELHQKRLAHRHKIKGTDPPQYDTNIALGTVIDDCQNYEKEFRKKEAGWLWTNGRSSHVTVIFVSQNFRRVSEVIRTNFSYVFVANPPADEADKIHHDVFRSKVPKLAQFEHILAEVNNMRTDHEKQKIWLVYDNVNGKNFENTVYWFKFDCPPDLKDYKLTKPGTLLEEHCDDLYEPNWAEHALEEEMQQYLAKSGMGGIGSSTKKVPTAKGRKADDEFDIIHLIDQDSPGQNNENGNFQVQFEN